jgi:hypothetical protein
LPDLFQNSAQYLIYRSTGILIPTYILAAHPNYEPDSDNPDTAETATFVTAIQGNNENNAKVDCTVGGTFQATRTYLKTTSSGEPYLQVSHTFTKYNTSSGAVIGTYSFDPVYFNLASVTPPPAPSYGF